jgi:hypothetical protein
MAGDVVVRRARPLGERAQQLGWMQQHERARDRAHDDQRTQPEGGAPDHGGGDGIGALEAQQVR